MKKIFWFVLIAAVLVTLAAATWVVSALRAPIRRRSDNGADKRRLRPVPQPQAA